MSTSEEKPIESLGKYGMGMRVRCVCVCVCVCARARTRACVRLSLSLSLCLSFLCVRVCSIQVGPSYFMERYKMEETDAESFLAWIKVKTTAHKPRATHP